MNYHYKNYLNIVGQLIVPERMNPVLFVFHHDTLYCLFYQGSTKRKFTIDQITIFHVYTFRLYSFI